jgi:hypothetical protein
MAEAIPTPETPTASKSNGSQQQLDATTADTSVPALVIICPRRLLSIAGNSPE